jgi:hypothetical protein
MEELLEKFLDNKEKIREDSQRQSDWESGRVAPEERTIVWEFSDEGKG